MKTQIDLKIPLGFRLEEETRQMKIWDAETLLLTKKRWKYAKAVRTGDEAVLYSRHILCPHCSSRLPADEPLRRKESEMRDRISRWASLQLALPGCEVGDTVLLADPIDLPVILKCPVCGETARRSCQTRYVVLTGDRRKVCMKSQITGIDEILSLEWAKTGEIRFSLPVYEVLVFNIDRGRIYVRVEDLEGRVLARRDVTAHPQLLKGGASDKLLATNKVVLRNVKRLFQKAWNMELPYQGREVDLDALFRMTLFRGYPREFYVCIPYTRNSWQIDKSFRAIAGKIRHASRLEGVYARSTLPQAKSLRRTLFETPGLFFYLVEIERMWQAMGDINLLRRFLRSTGVFAVLSSLHTMPGMLAYLRDYCQVRGTSNLCDGLEKHWDTVREKAIDYSCMSPTARREAQKRWQGKQDQGFRSERAYAVPMAKPDPHIADCHIDGYDFFWLRTSNDYALAAQGLHNCLDTWSATGAPVVCIRRKAEYVGAVEVNNGQIVQARGFDNCCLELDPRLYGAFEKWRQRYQLEWADDEDDFDGDFPERDLPF